MLQFYWHSINFSCYNSTDMVANGYCERHTYVYESSSIHRDLFLDQYIHTMEKVDANNRTTKTLLAPTLHVCTHVHA